MSNPLILDRLVMSLLLLMVTICFFSSPPPPSYSFIYGTACADTSNGSYETCESELYLYSGDVFEFGTTNVAGGVCVGDTYIAIQMFNNNNEWEGCSDCSNDDIGSPVGCSYLKYTIPTTTWYKLILLCYKDTSCGGTLGYKISRPE